MKLISQSINRSLPTMWKTITPQYLGGPEVVSIFILKTSCVSTFFPITVCRLCQAD